MIWSFSKRACLPSRFSRECLLPGFVGSGCGSFCGLSLQHGQAAGVWLWGKAPPGRWQDQAETHPAAAADFTEGRGRHRHDQVTSLRLKWPPWQPGPQPTGCTCLCLYQAFIRWIKLNARHLGVGGLQSWPTFWRSFLKRLAWLPWISQRHPRSHEDTQQPCGTTGE